MVEKSCILQNILDLHAIFVSPKAKVFFANDIVYNFAHKAQA